MLGVNPCFQCLGNRPENAVRQQDAEEGSDEGGGNFFTDFRGGAADGTHGDDNAKHGGYDAKAGHGVTHCGDRMGDEHGFVMMFLEVDVEDFCQIVIFNGTGQQDFQGVAQQRHRMMAGHERRIFGKDVAGFRIFDMRFEPDQSILARFLEDLIEYLQQLRIRFGTVWVRLQHGKALRQTPFEHGGWVGNDQRSQTGATDDDKFVDLNQYGQFAVVHDIATDHGAKNDYQAYDDEHAVDLGEKVVESVRDELRGSARWLTIHDDLLRGLTHELSNRIGTISAIAHMAELKPESAVTTAATLRAESDRMEALLHLIRVLPRRADSVFEPVVPTDVTAQAVALHGHHPELRDLHTDVVLDGDLQPAYVDPAVLTMAIVVAVGTAHRAVGVGGRATLTISSTTEVVRISVRGLTDAAAVDGDAERDCDAVTWLLRPFGGSGEVVAAGLCVVIPTLQAARRARAQ